MGNPVAQLCFNLSDLEMSRSLIFLVCICQKRRQIPQLGYPFLWNTNMKYDREEIYGLVTTVVPLLVVISPSHKMTSL